MSKAETAPEVFEAAVKAEEDGDSERAIRLYEECSRIDPKAALPLLRLARLLCDEGEYKRAIHVGLQARKLRPRSHFAHYLIANSYGRLGRWTMAERYFHRNTKSYVFKTRLPLMRRLPVIEPRKAWL